MPDNSKGKMFLAEERGRTEKAWFRSYNTFNFGDYQQENKKSFGQLYVLNDDTLAGERSVQLSVQADSVIILLPTVGALAYKDSLSNQTVIKAGQAQFFAMPRGATIEISNPFEKDVINFLQLWIKKPVDPVLNFQVTSFDFETNKNKLIALFQSGQSQHKTPLLHPKFFIGKFSARSEIEYTLADPHKSLFVFTVEGAFEVQYRLLGTRDGLALWDIDTVRIEALSADAIIMVIEL
ncbi:MAG: pirin family protein [Chitinophagaceae bacterium]|nr:pirin family protein [Chitinophagaceae bacterium]